LVLGRLFAQLSVLSGPTNPKGGEEVSIEQPSNEDLLSSLVDTLRNDRRVGFFGLALWTVMLLLITFVGVYHIFYVLFIFGYILAVIQLRELAAGFRPLHRVLGWVNWQRFSLVVMIALALRWLMLLQDQVINTDLDYYVARSSAMLDGQLPYLDFSGGTKPPAYQYMLYVMGATVGDDAFRFRALFSVADAIVAGLVYSICRTRYDVGHSLAMGMTYAMCPVAIVTIGLTGHYEGVTGLFAAASLLALWKGRRHSSALALGISFSLKIYAAAILPFMAVASARTARKGNRPGNLSGWIPSLRYGLLFSLAAILSLVPLAIISRDAVSAYFGERGVFQGWGSFTAFMRWTFDVEEIAGIEIGWIPIAIIGLLLLLFFLHWLRDSVSAVRRWTKVTIVVLTIHYGFHFALFFPYYEPANYEVMMVVFLAAWFSVMGYLLYRLLPRIELGTERELSLERSGLAVAASIALILFVLSMPTLGPWYFLWPLPFVLAIEPRDVRETFLMLMFWHAVGKGVALLPGLAAVN